MLFPYKKKSFLGGCIRSLFAVIWMLIVTANAEGTIYQVGPEKRFKNINDVPLDSLEPGDIVKIFYRDKPYTDRFIIRRSGTEEKPIVFSGVPSNRKLPVIDGRFARQDQKEYWKNSGRWLIKIGDKDPGSHVIIQNLVLRNANNSNPTFEPDGKRFYTANAAGIFVRSGKNVTIQNCRIHSCGNAVLTYYAPEVTHLKLRRCIIYRNGDHVNRSSDQEHNVYLQGTNTIVEFCHFGKPNSNGQNLKDRGLNTIIRYNWIEEGLNRQLDLVDHKQYTNADAYVYGNVIIQGKTPQNFNMIHWGGDSGYSRSGTLFFFNNTVVGHHSRNRFIDVQYSDCKVDLRNNAFVGTGLLWNLRGTLRGTNNWFSSSLKLPEGKYLGLQGDNPGFLMNFVVPFMPFPGSDLINTGIPNTPLPVKHMPFPNARGLKRPIYQITDIGAYEFSPSLVKKIYKRN